MLCYYYRMIMSPTNLLDEEFVGKARQGRDHCAALVELARRVVGVFGLLRVDEVRQLGDFERVQPLPPFPVVVLFSKKKCAQQCFNKKKVFSVSC